MSAMEDSNSGDETYHQEDEGNQSPKSESQSRSSSPAPESPPASPRSPSSPREQDAPESPPSSPSSSRSSPSSPVEQKSSSPRSPGSPSSANGQQSEHEASDVEMSDAEEADNKEKDNEENAEKSGDERSHSEAEDSDREENIPEVNIDSGDEVENKSEHNASDNEGEQSGDEDDKDERGSVHVDSEAENKSDDENAARKSDDEEKADGQDKSDDEADNNSDDESVENKNSSPKRSSSPIQTEKDAEDSDNEEIERPKRKEKDSDAEDNADSDSDAESEISEVGGLIADIFGESDEEEEFEGFKEEDIAAGKAGKEEIKPKKEKRKRAAIMSDSEDEKEEEPEKEENDDEKESVQIEDVPAPPDDEEGEVPEEPPAKKKKPDPDDSDDEDDGKIRDDRGDFVSDFDLMMQKKKEESSKRRKRRDVDLISDSDDLIADIIAQMRMAAEEDKELNKVKRTATKKLKILPMVLSQLKKQDLKMAFLDQGVLNVIAEWLTPLPDRSLPHLNIRAGMLKQLSDYPNFDPSLLKSSGIGRALMYLYKHPKETKENRERAGKLITEWARPIFNVTTNYHALTKEEREQRDYDHIPKRRRKDQGTSEAEEPEVERKDIEKEMTGESTAIRPGDKGWIGRARVPLPSNKDYVNRPKWNVEMEFGRGPSKKPLTRIEKHMRSIQDKKRISKQQRAITISIEGRKMAI